MFTFLEHYRSHAPLLIATLLVVGFLTSFFTVEAIAQEREGGGATETMELQMERIDYGATDTNVCDGVTCADGSCAATADMCTEVAPAPLNYNNTRSNRSSVAALEPASTTDVVRPTSTTERAQNHNSSRSNAPGEGYVDPIPSVDDDDGRMVPPAAAGRDIDKASPLLFDTLRWGGDEDSDGDGLPDVEETDLSARSFAKFDDIKGEVTTDSATGERRLVSVAVSARDVRMWTEEDKAAFAELQASTASNTPEADSLLVTEHMLENDAIEELKVSEEGAEVRYRTTMKLFGVLPLERELVARVRSGGEAEVDYPWYRFLSSVPQEEQIRGLLAETRDLLVLVPGRG